MVRKISNVVTAPRNTNITKEIKEVKKQKLKGCPRKKYRYMRKCNDVEVSGPSRMRKFARSCLLMLDSGDSFYNSNNNDDHKLYLDASKGVTKITQDANKELCSVANQIIRSYVSRACVLAKLNNSTRSVTVKNLAIVDKYFSTL